MSEWTSLNQIMRDLSVAQGNYVPAPIETYGSAEPPVSYIKEEIETEFNKAGGDVDFSKPPDYSLIQKFITLVSNDKKNNENIEQESNLNPMSPEFIPQSEMAVIKHRAEKNVAMKSILEVRTRTLLNRETEQKQHINMFKKKDSTAPNEKKIATVKPMQSVVRRTRDSRQYVPSTLANEYYNKYISNAKFRVELKEDIWARAERVMKEIDKRNEKRKTRSSSSSQDLDNTSTKSSRTSCTDPDNVNLECHRHILLDNIEDCVVCNIAAKHGYDFSQELDVDATPSTNSLE